MIFNENAFRPADNRHGGQVRRFAGGRLYIVLEWALSSVGALLVLLVLTVTAILVACRITPQALLEMFRPPEYEYEDEDRARAL